MRVLAITKEVIFKQLLIATFSFQMSPSPVELPTLSLEDKTKEDAVSIQLCVNS